MLSSDPCSSEGVPLLPFARSALYDIFFLAVFERGEQHHFHLASHGCNMWEMEHTEELHMLWMHVDGSP